MFVMTSDIKPFFLCSAIDRIISISVELLRLPRLLQNAAVGVGWTIQ